MPQVRAIERNRKDLLGEGPLWVASEDAVYWVDILGQRLNRLALNDNEITEWGMPDVIGWVIEGKQGLVAGIGRQIVRLALDPVSIEVIADLEPGVDANRINDAKADASGRLWAGTMPFGCDMPTGALYRIDHDATATRMDEGYCVANGPAITADGRWLLHTDSVAKIIYRFPLHDDGSLGRREDFIRFELDWGSPDGMTFDADGGLWVACWGAGCVRRFDPQGRSERSIALPATQITSCTFAGPELDRMFVTSAADGVTETFGGALFEINPGCCGLLPQNFAG